MKGFPHMANTSIGTAWIQVKPSTKGLRQAINSELNGVQVGKVVGANLSAGLTGAIAGISSQLTQQISNLVSGAISGGIKRFDIIERFPKVMESIGLSASNAEAAIDKLVDGVTGLPTALSDVVSETQRLATITGDVDKAADWALAISDAMLGVTGDSEQAALAVEQFTQVLERGVPTGQDWKTIYQTAPGIMNELAKSLGYASGAMSGDMYTALQKGTLSIEDMMDALVKLDKEGSDSMDSLQKIVRTSTGGINTQITIMRQTVENMIKNVLSGKGIETQIETLAQTITSILPPIIEAVSKTFLGVAKVIPQVAPQIIDAIADILPDLIDITAELIVQLAEALPDLIKIIADKLPVLMDAIGKALITLADSEVVWKSMAIIASILFGSKLLTLFTAGFRKFLAGKFANVFGSSLKVSLGDQISSVFKALGTSIQNLVEPLAKTLETVLKSVGKGIAGFFKAFADPAILEGAAIFAVAAAAVAVAILAIGKAIEWAAPGIRVLMDDVIMPLANFLRDTVLMVIDAVTTGLIRLTNDALIPLGEFLMGAFLSYIQTISTAIIQVTNGAIIPLMNTLSGTFTNVLNSIAKLINGTLYTALTGIRGIIDSVGDGFIKMGSAIRNALEGARGILAEFAALISSVADSLVAIVALATRQSITYGRGFAYVTRAATGGLVGGIGTDTSDSNLYALSKGEYVIRAAAAREIGYNNLDQMNATGEVSGNQITNYFTINSNQDPEEIANMVSRKIALKTQGVLS